MKIRDKLGIGAAMLLAVGIVIIVFSRNKSSNNSFAQSNAQFFKEQLSSNSPVKLLRYTEIDRGLIFNGEQRHYLAAIDTNGFFQREYLLMENPITLISPSNLTHRSHFYGQNDDVCWNINVALQIEETAKTNPIVTYIQLGTKDAKDSIDTVLNFGVSAYLVKRGSFVWNLTSSNRFSVQIADGVTVTRISNGLRTTMINLSGRIVLKNGLVSELHYSSGSVYYEYAKNPQVPSGFPTKITTRDKIILIEQLEYGRADESEHLFDPEFKFISADIPTVYLTENGQHILQKQGYKLQPPPPSP